MLRQLKEIYRLVMIATLHGTASGNRPLPFPLVQEQDKAFSAQQAA